MRPVCSQRTSVGLIQTSKIILRQPSIKHRADLPAQRTCYDDLGLAVMPGCDGMGVINQPSVNTTRVTSEPEARSNRNSDS